LSNEEKTNDYENFEKGMIYMKILKKGRGSREKGEEETKSMPHAPVDESAQTMIYKTLHIHIKPKDRAACIPLKPGENSGAPERCRGF
jgi:hypothetical protein